ncbi:MAG: hypothetical protein ACW99A_13175 [Candidatus Kariarchaeaceae archaeon]
MVTGNLETDSFHERIKSFHRENQEIILKISLVLIGILAVLIKILVSGLLSKPEEYLQKEDIYFIWLEGKRISEGTNPYSYIYGSDFLNNEKYATYLPFFYVLSAMFHFLGITSFYHWIIFMRFVSTIFFIIISIQLFKAFYYRSIPFAVFATLYWMFNRWTFIVIYVVHIDFIPLSLLIYSLQNVNIHRDRSLLAYGLSLTMKHMAIFLFPMYLILLHRDPNIRGAKNYIANIVRMGIIPFIFSLPFMIWDFKAFIYSMSFNGTRLSSILYDELHEIVSNDALIAYGIVNRLFMLSIMILVYVIFLQRRIGKFTTSFLIFVIFIEFNLALFDQYKVWRIALLPFVFIEFGVFDGKEEPIFPKKSTSIR